jgi:ubiquinone/menaquinone biosynthesis C-methylase UbiE
MKNSYSTNPENWNKVYGKIFSKRAKGILPEMESSKATSKILSKIIKSKNSILDVGCGVGHYYVSLNKRIKHDFEYFGIDLNSEYIRIAKEIFKNNSNVQFK